MLNTSMRYSEFSNEQIDEGMGTRFTRSLRKVGASIGAKLGSNKAKGSKKRLAATQQLVKQYMQYAGSTKKDHTDKKTMQAWIDSGKSPFDSIISAPLLRDKWSKNYDNFIELLYTTHVEKGMIEAGDQEGEKNDTSDVDLDKLVAAAATQGITVKPETRAAWNKWAANGYRGALPKGVNPKLLNLFGAMLKDGKLKGS